MELAIPIALLAGFIWKTRRSTDKDVMRGWLEDVHGEKAMEWVKERNELSVKALGDPKEADLYNKMLAALDSKDKIPHVSKLGPDDFYNFWKDEKHVRGIWRKTTFAEYQKKDPKWTTVLDLDALSEKENENWVWSGYTLPPGPKTKAPTRAIIELSRGGADATVCREFDLVNLKFIDAPEGFVTKEAKTNVYYKDENTLLIGSDFGPGSLTSSGYARTIKEWKRGTPIESAPTVFEALEDDVFAFSYVDWNHGQPIEWRQRYMTFYTTEYFLSFLGSKEFHKLNVPEDAKADVYGDVLLVELRTDWTPDGASTAYQAGSLLSIPLKPYLKNGDVSNLKVLFAPTERISLEYYSAGIDILLLSVLDNVCNRFIRYQYNDKIPTYWNELPALNVSFTASDKAKGDGKKSFVKLDSRSVDVEESNLMWITATSFNLPTSLFILDVGTPEVAAKAIPATMAAAKGPNPLLLRSLPAQFNADLIEVSQHEATSKDGTKIPYFLVRQPMKGPVPTILNGYGGFEISELPYYSFIYGLGWLELGGAFVLANIRGGGEFGPKWHQAALKGLRYKAFEDFEAVGEDLIKTGVTTAGNLGITGGSNGGLLVGNCMVRRPELFGAVVCEVPLLDMMRYTKLLAGASWIAEYGDPEIPEEREFLLRHSPYHQLKNISKVKYPSVLFTTSTRDDRVHPGHARKMVHRMIDLGHKDSVYYYENIEGGHAGAADNSQRAYVETLCFSFFRRTLGMPKTGLKGSAKDLETSKI